MNGLLLLLYQARKSLLAVCDQSGFLIFASGKALAHFFLLSHILIVSFPTEVIKAELGIHRL